MDENIFTMNKDAITYLEENIKNYYFKKRYQRYNPSSDALVAFKDISEKTNVLVLATRNCPICIATIPILIRLHLDVQNPNLDIRVIEDGSPYMPSFLEDKKSPFIVFYDSAFNELFRLEQKEIKDNFENALIEELKKLVSA